MQFQDGITLDRFQTEAIAEIEKSNSVLVCAPTGSGKTLIAEHSIRRAVEKKKRIIYTAPIKALNNQKFRDFSLIYGDLVGIKTGDVTINPDAQIILMTTEIFRNTIFETPQDIANVEYVILDEIHYLDDIERGTVWEECIIFAPLHIKFLCLSATVSNYKSLVNWFNSVRHPYSISLVSENERKVPLVFHVVTRELGITPIEKILSENLFQKTNVNFNYDKLTDSLKKDERLPAIFFCFNRKDCETIASKIHNELLTEKEKAEILSLFDELTKRFNVRDFSLISHMRQLLSKGVCYHHAGLLPSMKEIIEQIFSKGLVKMLFATETFAVGINMPARSVVFNTVEKFNGKRQVLLTPREFHQMAGRAGRRGIDKVGYVYAISPITIAKKFCSKTILGQINPIRSQFNLSYSTILTLYKSLKDNIFTACEKSLSNFLDNPNSTVEWKVKQLKSKLTILKNLNYINNKSLTDKGEVAAKIYGYELPVVELLENMQLGSMNIEQLCCIFLSICFEAKKSSYSKKPESRWFKELVKGSVKIVNDIVSLEERYGLKEKTKPLDYSLSSVMISWINNPDINKIQELTTTDPGDIIRYFRLTIQVIRNTLYIINNNTLKSKLLKCVQLINKNEVDAEAQLLTPLSDTVQKI
ncbi:MAG: DEAD/DEAH box helicase [Planctomycetes bacterium]|nr:DEAD/DEAH box helicase [Planctomycetota bacterium]